MPLPVRSSASSTSSGPNDRVFQPFSTSTSNRPLSTTTYRRCGALCQLVRPGPLGSLLGEIRLICTAATFLHLRKRDVKIPEMCQVVRTGVHAGHGQRRGLLRREVILTARRSGDDDAEDEAGENEPFRVQCDSRLISVLEGSRKYPTRSALGEVHGLDSSQAVSAGD